MDGSVGSDMRVAGMHSLAAGASMGLHPPARTENPRIKAAVAAADAQNVFFVFVKIPPFDRFSYFTANSDTFQRNFTVWISNYFPKAKNLHSNQEYGIII